MNQKFPTVIGLTGVAGSGKDTLYNLFQERLANFLLEHFRNELEGSIVPETLCSTLPSVCRYAFADQLKDALRPSIITFTGIDILNCNREQKESVRPFLVGFGSMMRNLNPRYWIERISENVMNNNNNFVIITDVRYSNEAEWIKSCNGIIIHITRTITKDGIECPILPANLEEEKNDPLMKAKADFHLIWPTVNQSGLETEKVNNLLTTYVDQLLTDIFLTGEGLRSQSTDRNLSREILESPTVFVL